MTTLTSHAVHEGGFDWIGSIPPHWNRIRNAGLFRERNERGREDLELLAVTIAHGVLPQREYMEMSGRRLSASESGDLSNYKLVRRGDLVYNRMRMWQGAIGLAPCDGIVSPAYVVLTPLAGVNPRYFEYLFKTQAFICEAGRYSYGIADDQNSLRFEDFKTLYSAVPPVKEQGRIAAFLDHETARIDELVREQERLISQLEAKRAATISHSIRGGLSSEARSETGNAWVSSIPASWRLTRLKFEALAVDCLHSTPAYLESGKYPAVRTADLSPGRLDLSNALRVSREEYMARNTRLVPRQGDIIYSREGTFGIAAVVPAGAQLCLGQRVMLLRPYDMDSQFLMWQLNADFVYQQALQDQIGATAARVNMETVANYVLVAPPKQEQKAIAQFLNASLRDIDNGVTAARSLISLLNERRSALISAAVTGQLDLHNWQTPELEAVAEVA